MRFHAKRQCMNFQFRETCFVYSNSSRRAKMSQHKNIGSAQECFLLFENNLRFCVESFLYSFQYFSRSVLFLAQLSVLVFTFNLCDSNCKLKFLSHMLSERSFKYKNNSTIDTVTLQDFFATGNFHWNFYFAILKLIILSLTSFNRQAHKLKIYIFIFRHWFMKIIDDCMKLS